MKKIPKDEKGFSAVELVAVIVIICLIGTFGWAIRHKQSKKTSSSVPSSSNSQPAASSTTNLQSPQVLESEMNAAMPKIKQIGDNFIVYLQNNNLSAAYDLTSSAFQQAVSQHEMQTLASDTQDNLPGKTLAEQPYGSYEQKSGVPYATLVYKYSNSTGADYYVKFVFNEDATGQWQIRDYYLGPVQLSPTF